MSHGKGVWFKGFKVVYPPFSKASATYETSLLGLDTITCIVIEVLMYISFYMCCAVGTHCQSSPLFDLLLERLEVHFHLLHMMSVICISTHIISHLNTP